MSEDLQARLEIDRVCWRVAGLLNSIALLRCGSSPYPFRDLVLCVSHVSYASCFSVPFSCEMPVPATAIVQDLQFQALRRAAKLGVQASLADTMMRDAAIIDEQDLVANFINLTVECKLVGLSL